MEDEDRRQIGAHYTSERDILKVVRPLFLDDLRSEFEAIRADRSTRRAARLEEYQRKLSQLRFLDPACGCGNFLVITYRELRLVELEVLKERYPGGQQAFSLAEVMRLSQIDVDQFYGIEIEEWPARIAEVALWLMDHQMNLLITEAFSQSYQRLPLTRSPHISNSNALRVDWRTVLPATNGNYVLGNPPFVGKQFRTAIQERDMAIVLGDLTGRGLLDYVTTWYFKAAEYIADTDIRVGFVSTNSISQGEQVGILWGELFRRYQLKIIFAHRTFSWRSEARGAAHVHVVIIGFTNHDVAGKAIYESNAADDTVTRTVVTNISPYLVQGNDTVVKSRTRPIPPAPSFAFGSMANDGGHLMLTSEEREESLQDEPGIEPFIKRIIGSEEFLHNLSRWCLWLVDATPHQIANSEFLRSRVALVRAKRLESRRETTRNLARTPQLFGEIRQPQARYLAIPKTSSELRPYIPIDFRGPDVIANTEIFTSPDSTLYHFGVLTSEMHMAWVRHVCGRLESRYRYSTTLVYNNFPWPVESDEQRTRVEQAAQDVLSERERFPDSTLAELYDPLTMPQDLLRAHERLDRAVDRCYRREPFETDRQRVEHLFAMYEHLSAPLLPRVTTRRARRVPRAD